MSKKDAPNPLDAKYKDMLPTEYQNSKKDVCTFIRNASKHSKDNAIPDNEEIPEEIFKGFTDLESIENLIFGECKEHDVFVVRLYVVKSNLDTLGKKIKGMFAKFVSEVGTSHLAVQVSDKMVHWYDSGLVLVQGYEGSNATAVFYPQKGEDSVPAVENTPENRQAICKIIQNFNCTKVYDIKKTNCQTFAQEIFKSLGFDYEFSKMDGPVGDYLSYIIGKGRNSKKHCFIVDNKYKILKSWDNHEQLDEWSTDENLELYKSYYPLIKAFHRGFQMREKALVKRGVETYKGDQNTCPLGLPTLFMKNLMEKFNLGENYNFFDIDTSTSFKVSSSGISGVTSGLSSNRN